MPTVLRDIMTQIDHSPLARAATWAKIAIFGLLALSVVDIAEWVLRVMFPQFNETAAMDIFLRLYDFIAIPLFAAYIVNCRWIYVAAKTYAPRATPAAPIRPHWAVWSNLIPVANMISPFIQMRRIYAAAHKRQGPLPKWLWVWWFAWIYPFALAIVFVYALTVSASQDVIENGFSFEMELVFLTALFADIIAAVLFLRLVTQISASQQRDSDVFA